jgi:hypothetical protein
MAGKPSFGSAMAEVFVKGIVGARNAVEVMLFHRHQTPPTDEEVNAFLAALVIHRYNVPIEKVVAALANIQETITDAEAKA